MRIGAGLLGVLVLAGVGWFVFQGLTGKSGGAASPDEAVEQLVKALNAKDPAAALAVLDPDDVSVLGDVVPVLEDRATKNGVAASGKALEAFAISINGLSMDDDELGEGVVKVTIDDGEAEVAFDADKVSERVRSIGATSERTTIDASDLVARGWDDDSGQERKVEPFVVAVERNGGWYLSPTHTAMQYWVELKDLPQPDFSSQSFDDLKGADSPQDALEGFANSIDRLDVDDWMAYVPDSRRRLLAAYQDAIEEALERDGVDPDGGFSFDVDDLDTNEKSLPKGDKALTVTSAKGSAQASADEAEVTWRYDGRCLRTSGGDEDTKKCANRVWGGLFQDRSSDWVPPLLAIGAGSTVVASKEHGGWVVDPLASVVRTVKDQIESASTEQLFGWTGLAAFAPATGELTMGKTNKVEMNDGGYAVFDVSLTKGTTYAVSISGDACDDDAYEYGCASASAVLLGAQVDGDDNRLELYGSDVFAATRSGTARLLISGEVGDAFDVWFGPVPEESMPSGNHMQGTLSADRPAIAYKFTAPDSQTWTVDFESFNGDFSILDAKGRQVDCYGVCSFDAGTVYRIVISGAPGADYDVTLRQGGATIDGETSVTGFVDSGDRVSHDLFVASGSTAEVTLEGDDYSADLDLELGDGSDSSRSSGSSESLTVTGPYSGTIDVFAFSGSSSYTLSVSEY